MDSRVITHTGEETLKRVREDNLIVRLSDNRYIGRLRTTVNLRVQLQQVRPGRSLYRPQLNPLKHTIQQSVITHSSSFLSQASEWKKTVISILNSPQPHSDKVKGGESTTLVGLLKLGCRWKMTFFMTTPRSSFVAPRT